jgi:acetoin utilization protein AcuC
MSGRVKRGFVPIAGLHHAGRAHAAGFCVFNDIGVVIERLKRDHGLLAHRVRGHRRAPWRRRLLRVRGRPGSRIRRHARGRALPVSGHGHRVRDRHRCRAGTKLNLPLPPGAGDAEFFAAWPAIESHLDGTAPEFVIFQCGADSLGGDPIAHLALTEEAHAHAAARLCAIAERFAAGRILGFGGGGLQPAQHRARLDPRGAGLRRVGLSGAVRVDFALHFRALLQEIPCSDPV